MTGDRAITAVTIWDASVTGGGEWANVQGLGAHGAVDFTPDGHGLVVDQREARRRSRTSRPARHEARSVRLLRRRARGSDGST